MVPFLQYIEMLDKKDRPDFLRDIQDQSKDTDTDSDLKLEDLNDA